MRNKINIRNLIHDDADNILDLIKRVYGNSYFEKEYYNIDFIQRTLKRKHAYWKGAFLNNKLIGQMLFNLNHNAGYLKLTMVDPEYQGSRIITKIGLEMMKVKKKMNSSIFKCVYAIINENNKPMIRVLNNFNFKFLGRIPYHENNKGLIIFGLILYDLNWKIIKPHLKISVAIYKSIQTAGIKRIISSSNSNKNFQIIKCSDIEIIRSDEKNKFPNIILICKNKREKIAEITENQAQKCWYDFRFLKNNIDLLNKKKVFSKILHEYLNHNINAISFPLPIDDIISQNILIDLGAEYYAYLPFYYKDYDSVLLGFSKIEEKVL